MVNSTGTGYMTADEADTITYRLITNLLPAGLSVAPTTLPETTISPNPLANETVTITPTGTVNSAAIVRECYCPFISSRGKHPD